MKEHSDDLVKLSVGGDIMCLKQETDAVLKKYGKIVYSDYVCGLDPIFKDSDYSVANLETPISPSNMLTSAPVRFNTDKSLLSALKKIGFDFFSTANNHCLDCGIGGLKETLVQLDSFGFSHDGTYALREHSETVFVAKVQGLKIAILSFTFGTNSQINGEMLPPDEMWRVALTKKQNIKRNLPFNPDAANGDRYVYIADDVLPSGQNNPINIRMLEACCAKVRRAKTLADFVVVMPHVGGQYNPGPAGYAKHVVAKMKEAGADLVVAGHPHVPQRSDGWSGTGSFACYSLGNLCFTPDVGYYVPNTLAEFGLVLHAYIDHTSKKLTRISFSVVKNVVDDQNCTHTVPITELMNRISNSAQRDRLMMENEVIVNRFRGTACDVECGEKEYFL